LIFGLAGALTFQTGQAEMRCSLATDRQKFSPEKTRPKARLV